MPRGMEAPGDELAPTPERQRLGHTWRPTTRVSPAPAYPLSGPDSGARLDALIDLATRGGPDAGAELATLAIGDVDPSVRLEAVAALAGKRGEVARHALSQALDDREPEVRRAAVEALADMGGTGTVQVLAGALQDADPAVRAEAVYALGELGGHSAIELLRRTADTDESAPVRRTAQDYLAELSRAQPSGAQ